MMFVHSVDEKSHEWRSPCNMVLKQKLLYFGQMIRRKEGVASLEDQKAPGEGDDNACSGCKKLHLI